MSGHAERSPKGEVEASPPGRGPAKPGGGLSPFPTERLLISSIVKAGPGVLEAKESLESEDDRLHGSAARHMGFHVIFWSHH